MKIRFYRSSDREALQSYCLTDLRFTSHPKEAVADLENRYAILGLVEDEKSLIRSVMRTHLFAHIPLIF